MTAVDSVGVTQTDRDTGSEWAQLLASTRRNGYCPIVRRLVPRLVGDLIAVATGLAIFDWINGGFHERPALFALVYLGIAAVVALTHVCREGSRVEEVVLSIKAATIAMVRTQ
jgi:hypothetical protein